jgi:threonine dehydrogenase-like Zn-dependent dehydrogenase
MDARAAVLVSDRKLEILNVPVPSELPAGWGLLRVEGNGICGSDFGIWSGELTGSLTFPLILGHEFVGRIEELPPALAAAWDLAVGDRIAVEPFARCGGCPECLTGRGNFCRRRFIYGSPPLERAPGITGGLAEYVALHPRSTVYRISPEVSVEDAVLFNPLGNSFEWTLQNGGVGVGDRVLILGAGQRGLGCVIAAREAGASQVIVTELAAAEHKLEIARRFGATATIVADRGDIVGRVNEITDGEGVDVALDLVPGATAPVLDAIAVTRPEGTVVLAGMKGGRAVEGFATDEVCRKGLVLKGSFGLAPVSTMRAIQLIESGRYPLADLHSHTVGLDDAEHAIRTLGGETEGEPAVHITVVP